MAPPRTPKRRGGDDSYRKSIGIAAQGQRMKEEALLQARIISHQAAVEEVLARVDEFTVAKYDLNGDGVIGPDELEPLLQNALGHPIDPSVRTYSRSAFPTDALLVEFVSR